MEDAPDFAVATELVARLDPRPRRAIGSEVDLLGAIALGTPNKTIANSLDLHVKRIENFVQGIYGPLGLVGVGRPQRFRAMTIGWAARILGKAQQAPGDFQLTQLFIGAAGLKPDEIATMDKLGLTIEELRLLQLQAKGETEYSMADSLNLAVSGVRSRKIVLWNKLGRSNKPHILQYVTALDEDLELV